MCHLNSAFIQEEKIVILQISDLNVALSHDGKDCFSSYVISIVAYFENSQDGKCITSATPVLDSVSHDAQLSFGNDSIHLDLKCSRLRQISRILIIHPGLASVQPVYSGFGNYIIGEWPTIGHKWLLSVVFVLMDRAAHGHILQRNDEISNNSNNRLCWSNAKYL
jgi:hypothetical protein